METMDVQFSDTAEKSKIDRIKDATVWVISKKGFVDSSVMDIAKRANVSVGYLYRYYASKKELINDIIVTMYNRVLGNIEQILDRNDNVDDICQEMINYYFSIYRRSPETIQFIVMLVNDFSFEATQNQKNFLIDICNRFYARCTEKEGIRKDITIEEVYIAFITIPIQSLSMQLRGIVFHKATIPQTKLRIKTLSLRMLKENK